MRNSMRLMEGVGKKTHLQRDLPSPANQSFLLNQTTCGVNRCEPDWTSTISDECRESAGQRTGTGTCY